MHRPPLRVAVAVFAPLLLAVPATCQLAALRGLDPIALAKDKEEAGKPEFVVDRCGFRYQFASAANRETFLADPEPHEIQFGGACARMGPLSGAGDPQRWHVHGERIYIFASDQCRDAFKKRPDAFLPVLVTAPTDAAAIAAGKALLGRAAAAHGGSERIRAWRTYRHARTSANAKATTTEQWRLQLLLPSAARTEYDYTLDGRTWRYVQIVSPDAQVFVDEGKVREMHQTAWREVRTVLGHEPLVALRRCLDGEAVATAAGKRDVAGIAVDELTVFCEGSTTTFGVGPDGRVRTARFRGRGASLWFGDVEVVFSDFEEHAGLVVPAGLRATFDGKEAPELTERRVQIAVDAALDSASFQPPK
jgi:YHS domain-containing protein